MYSRCIARIGVVAAFLAAGPGVRPASAQIEVAGELFVDLDAADATAGEDVWENNGTLDAFVKRGEPLLTEHKGVPAVSFNSGFTLDAYQCLDDAPEGLVGLDPTRTIEVWAFNPEIANEETLVAWGKRGGPAAGTNMSFNYGTNASFGAVGHWGAPDIGWATVPIAGQWHHLAYTYDGTTTRVYADGIETNSEVVGSGVINTYCCTKITLAAQLESDGVTLNTGLVGTLSLGRVRVHDGVLTAEQVLHNYEEERDDFPVDVMAPRFTNAPDEDTFVAGEASYTRVLGIEGFPVPTLEVVEPPGGAITAQGVFTYVLPDPQPDSFAVSVRATNAGGTAEASWTVTKEELPPPGQLAVAGELFVDLDARDPTAGEDSWDNLGTLDDFMKVGEPVLEDVEGAPAVTFNGGFTVDAYQCLDDAPDGLVGPDPTRTIEVWAYNPEIAGEETLVAWGKRGGPAAGTNMSFNYGTHAAFGAVGHWGDPDIGWGTVPIAGRWHHLVYTFDGATTRVYADGAEANSEELGPGVIDTYCCTKITLAAQLESDGVTLNTGLVGTLSLARVRVHDGVLSPLQVLHNYNEERDGFPFPPIFLDAPGEDFVASGTAAYTRTLTVQGSPTPSLEVVEPAGATITAEGLFAYTLPDPEPASFVVTVRASNAAGEAEASWTVDVVIPPVLTVGPVHRYSFTDDATDSVSGADGQLIGDVTFQDGQAVLANAGRGSAAGGAYIDLPNGIISALGNEATFEAWVSWDGPTDSSWQRIFDFGRSAGGEDVSDTGDPAYYIFLTPRSGPGPVRFGYNNGATGVKNERNIDGPDRLPDGSMQHVVVVWDGENTTAAMYLNGLLLAEDTATHMALGDLDDVNNWLGRSQFGADAMFNGRYDEFRIYNYPLSQEEIRGNYLLGADTVNMEGPLIIRGDTDGDGIYTIGDGIQILERLFVGRAAFGSKCDKTGDTDDSGNLTIGDAIGMFNYLFGGGRPPEPPAVDCGPDETADDLTCEETPPPCRP